MLKNVFSATTPEHKHRNSEKCFETLKEVFSAITPENKHCIEKDMPHRNFELISSYLTVFSRNSEKCFETLKEVFSAVTPENKHCIEKDMVISS
ncbi:hypothetical protein NQ315_003069 [Exocentrus adspersus]|uniref:Uncharacterized protein n=1 Tax=Exocentrus adspersus TaxID=1586481 RepID=A0AAV8W470_9CUCU|nr:hypothetical protein NQ315_003069 [Exocentrus adspersus]